MVMLNRRVRLEILLRAQGVESPVSDVRADLAKRNGDK